MPARIAVVMNQGSGGGAASRQVELRSILAEINPDIQVIAASGDLESAAQAASSSADVLVAAGGDGTVGAVAAVAIRNSKTFGVIPFGTLNHFADDAGLPTDLVAAAAIVAAGQITHIDYATAGERVFLNNASIGIYPKLVRRRERKEGKIGKWPAAALELWRIFSRPVRPHVVTVIDGANRHQLRTAFIFVGNNSYNLEDPGLSRRDSLTGGNLSFFALKHGGRRTLIMGLFRSLFGFQDHPAALSFNASNLTIESTSNTVDVALDGEVYSLPTPIHFEVHPGGLHLVAGPG